MAADRLPTAGEMQHRAAFQVRAQADDGAGNFEAGFVTQFARAARITPLTGGEMVMEARLQSVQTVSVRVRSDSSTRRVTPGWQIVDVTIIDGKPKNIAYNVLSIMNMDEKNIWLEFTCQSGKPG